MTSEKKAGHSVSFPNKQPEQLGFEMSGLRGLVEDTTDLECYINVNVKGHTTYLRRISKEGTI